MASSVFLEIKRLFFIFPSDFDFSNIVKTGPKRFDFSPLTGECSEGLGALIFFFKHLIVIPQTF